MDDINQLAAILGKVAIVVVILESALSALFNWRVYREVVNHRAWKTPLMFATGLVIVWQFGFDVFAQMLPKAGAVNAPADGNWLTMIVSALILAGGSSGVNTLFQNLGLRNPLPEAPKRPDLDEGEAWVSVLVNGAVPGIRYHVAFEEDAAITGPHLAGSVETRGWWARLTAAFGNQANRFPNYGGWSVKARQGYRITVVDTTVTGAVPKTVFAGCFAPRAIIDFGVSV
jgi:hypothetical protein